jgi:predicted enzyme related to lactoylglutathione lyase
MGQPVVHFEIGCGDKEKTEEFFSKLFDWKIERMGPASMISTGSESGIRGHITSCDPHHFVTVYELATCRLISIKPRRWAGRP